MLLRAQDEKKKKPVNGNNRGEKFEKDIIVIHNGYTTQYSFTTNFLIVTITQISTILA